MLQVRMPRPHGRALVLCCIVLVVLPVSASPAMAQATTMFRGINTHSLWTDRSAQDVAQELELVRATGSNVIRVDVGWSSLESDGKGRYSQWYVDRLDALMAAARARNLKVVATLHQTPCWASSAPETARQGCGGAWWERGVAQYPPNDATDYGAIARWFVTRYARDLAALEVWNEPNLGARFFNTATPAADYARLLKAAFAAVKASKTGVPVLAGALAAADRRFLEDLYAQRIKGHYNGISVHPYNEWRHPDDRWQQEWIQYTFLPGIESIRAAQIAHGDTAPLWVTEFGWPTDSTSSWRVTEEQQARFTVRAFEILAGMAYVRAAIVYELRDGGTDRTDMEQNFGLVRRDFTAKPSYLALRDAFAAASTAAAPAPAAPATALTPAPSTAATAPAPHGPAVTAAAAAPPPPAASAAPPPAAAPTPAGHRHAPATRSLAVRLIRRGRHAFAVGRAPARAALRITVRNRAKSRRHVRALAVTATRRGTFRRRVARTKRLSALRVQARLLPG